MGPCYGYYQNNFSNNNIYLYLIPALLIIGILVYIIINKSQKQKKSNAALKQLQFKFASGDLTEEEYNKKKQIILNH